MANKPTFAEEPEKSLPQLMNELNNSDVFTRTEAAVALGTMGVQAKPAVPLLIKLLEDRQPLAWVTAPKGSVVSRTTSGPPNTSPASEAAKALGKIKDKRANEPLAALLKTGSAYEKQDALYALEQIAPEENLPYFIAALGDPDVDAPARGAINDTVKAHLQGKSKDRLGKALYLFFKGISEEGQLKIIPLLVQKRDVVIVEAYLELLKEDLSQNVRFLTTQTLQGIKASLHRSPLPLVFGYIGILIGIAILIATVVLAIAAGEFVVMIIGLVIGLLILTAGCNGVKSFHDTEYLTKLFASQESVSALH